MTYHTAWFCVSCENELTYGQKMNSHGRCPKCGFKHPHANTIVATNERAYTVEVVKSGSWWKPNKKVRKFVTGVTP